MRRLGPCSLALVCWLAPACGRELVEVGDDGPTGTGGGTTGTGGTAGTAGTGGQAPGVLLPASPDTGLWRLTRTEYNNTIRDLLGDTTQAGDALPPDPTFNGLDNNAEVLSASFLDVSTYDDIAAQVVENALVAGSASRAALLTCDPVGAGAPCARSIVSAFARRAWRRPIASSELDDLMKALGIAASQGDGAEEGVKLALRMVLTSPNFLYRVELDPTPNTAGLHPVSPHELATRLSYFVWSSTPDAELLARADDGTLSRPEEFATQLVRVLNDAKSNALVENFGAQWLGSRIVADVAPDPKIFPTFDESLRQAMIDESQSFFQAFVQSDRNVTDLLVTDFTFANDRLARHYALPGVTGPAMRKVALTGNRRFGLLSQAGTMTLTSSPGRTSPTRRGKWVLERILCSPPPPPPAEVTPSLPDPSALPANATIRQRLAYATRDPGCATCHSITDPIGFALEHYDGIGAWRDAYPSNTIDATGQLPGGVRFDGARELSAVLKQDPRFTSCFTKTVFAYAFGRDPRSNGDKVAIDNLLGRFVAGGARIRELVTLVASSQTFQNRGGL